MRDVDMPTATGQRLQLKRWFLRTLVISLGTCAFVAVVALLLGRFNETTARILLTLGALAVHSGIAMVCAAFLERGQWVRLNVLALWAFGLSFCVLIVCIWWPGGIDVPVLRGVGTTAVLLGYYILAIPIVDSRQRGRHSPIPLLGLVICAAGLLMALVCIWAEETNDLTFLKATGVVAVIAFTLAQTCIVLRLTGDRGLRWILGATLLCAWAAAVLWSSAILFEPNDEFFYRLFGAVGVLDATGSLALLILAKLRMIGRHAKLESVPARLELRCPRCMTSQVLEAGKSKCCSCGLKFTIEIEEPRCAKCEYLLWQLPERRCPECGTEF